MDMKTHKKIYHCSKPDHMSELRNIYAKKMLQPDKFLKEVDIEQFGTLLLQEGKRIFCSWQIKYGKKS